MYISFLKLIYINILSSEKMLKINIFCRSDCLQSLFAMLDCFCIWATLVQVVEQVALQDPWVLTPEFTPKCVCV